MRVCALRGARSKKLRLGLMRNTVFLALKIRCADGAALRFPHLNGRYAWFATSTKTMTGGMPTSAERANASLSQCVSELLVRPYGWCQDNRNEGWRMLNSLFCDLKPWRHRSQADRCIQKVFVSKRSKRAENDPENASMAGMKRLQGRSSLLSGDESLVFSVRSNVTKHHTELSWHHDHCENLRPAEFHEPMPRLLQG